MKKSFIKSLDIYKILSDNNYRVTKIGCGITALVLTFTLGRCSVKGPIAGATMKEPNIPKNIEHTIESGDTLTSIAEKYGVTIESIIANNNLDDPNNIFVGDKLIINKNQVLEENEEFSEEILGRKRIKKYKEFSTLRKDDNISKELSRGIDLSAWNKVDWDKIEKAYKNNEISFVILRMAETLDGFNLDSTFEKNLSECNKRGIPYGVYVFSRGANENEINTETSLIIDYINNNLYRTKTVNGEKLDLNFNLSLPFYMDCFEKDASNQYNLYVNGNYDACKNLIDLWCSNIENEGYFTGVYCSGSFYANMTQDRLKDYSLWIAHYGPEILYDDVCEIGLNGCVTFDGVVKNQQVTEGGELDGIKGTVDVNVCENELIELVQDFYKKNQKGFIKRLFNK